MNGQRIAAFPGQADGSGHAIAAHGLAEVPLEAVAGLRRSLGPPGRPPFAATFLKASEDQTVVALAAVVRALETGEFLDESLAGWAVIAAPRSLGRLAAADALFKFGQGGASKVSPFLVPHHSLHSVSGTISQGFRMFGPNFGVGGNRRAVVEGLLTALALLDEGPVPGLWLVLSECDPEPVPGAAGGSLAPVVYRALALAFRAAGGGRELCRLRLVRREQGTAERPAPTVAELVQFLGKDVGAATARWTCPLGWGATLELSRAAGAVQPVPRVRHVA